MGKKAIYNSQKGFKFENDIAYISGISRSKNDLKTILYTINSQSVHCEICDNLFPEII